MKPHIAKAFTIAIFLALAGCKLVLPEVTHATVKWSQSGYAQEAELNNDQVRKLSEWFSLHGSGWSSSPASYLPMVEIRATHNNGETTIIIIQPGGVVVSNSDGQCVQRFSETVISALLNIVDVN